MNFLNLPVNQRVQIFNDLSSSTKLSAQSIEKDWWVTTVLRALFSSSFSPYIAFKGGTSLSKCWKLIDRFSEDVDIAIDREFLGFTGEMSKSQISDKLRRKSCAFVRGDMKQEIEQQLLAMGIKSSDFSVNVDITSVTTTDPETIEVIYTSILPSSTTTRYVRNAVLIEVGARSMMEPTEMVSIRSILSDNMAKAPFADALFEVRTVTPKRTFLEKAFLLHEEFAKSEAEIRVDRMSRHIYDLERLMDTDFAQAALEDKELYVAVVEHRKKFVGLKGFDYATLLPPAISFLPPISVIDGWRSDYEKMSSEMIYGDSLSFDELIERLSQLNERFRAVRL